MSAARRPRQAKRTKQPPPRIEIGAHQSASGGLWKAVEHAAEIGAEAVQLFGSSPQMWRKTNHKPEAFERFRAARAEAGIGQAWLHAMYLINLAAEADEQWEKSIDATVNALNVAHEAGVDGVVLHTGSHRGAGFEAVLPRVSAAIERIFDEAEGEAVLALETGAGQGGVIGATFAELGAILEASGSPRLQVCFDTCHVFAAGYEIHTEEGLARTLEEFDRAIGLERLAVVHANDSKAELGANRDRHENIGDGHIGFDGFRVLLGNPAFAGRAFLLEVPGIEGDGPDRENIERLSRIREELGQ